MDLLSEIINLSNWKMELLSQSALYEPWAFRFPCEHSGGFHIVIQGNCSFRTMGKTEKMERGDILFISQGTNHDLMSAPGMKPDNSLLLTQKSYKNEEGKIPLTTLLSARYEVPQGTIHPFFLELPKIILIRHDETPAHHPLISTIELVSLEMSHGAGSDLIIQKLTDVLLYYVIRHWMNTNPIHSPGWLGAFRDEKVKNALEALHSQPAKSWTLEGLAGAVGLSRASLASRFRKTLGFTPMDYLTKLRMEKGQALIRQEKSSLEEIARIVGYANAFAFSKAYKRVMGHPPSQERNVLPFSPR